MHTTDRHLGEEKVIQARGFHSNIGPRDEHGPGFENDSWGIVSYGVILSAGSRRGTGWVDMNHR